MSRVNKSDLVLILKRRSIVSFNGEVLTSSKISKLTVPILTSIIGETTAEENTYLEEVAKKRQKYMLFKTEELQAIAEKLGAPKSGSKAVIADAIICAEENGAIQINLDLDQQAVVSSTLQTIVIHANPGCGKTTLIGALVQAAHAQPQNICVLAYNKNARNIVINFLHKYGITPAKPDAVGVKVYTIDELCYNIIEKKIGGDAETSDVDDGEEYFSLEDEESHVESIKLAAEASCKFDMLIIDEAQDITNKYIPIMEQLKKNSKRVVILGDVNQQLYGRTTWFLSHKVTHVLRFNHRSSPPVVRYLNLYGKRTFPNYVEMVPTREIHGEVCSIAEDDIAVAYIENPAVIVLPISLTKYGMSECCEALQIAVHAYEPGFHVPSGSSDVRGIQTVRRLKGAEINTCIIYGFDKKTAGVDADYDKLLYVALSRAKNNIYICNGELPSVKIRSRPYRYQPGVGGGGERGYLVTLCRSKQILMCGARQSERNERIMRASAFISSAEQIRRVIGYKPITMPLDKAHDYIIAVDIETSDRIITEIGAVAILRGTVVGELKVIAKSITEFTPDSLPSKFVIPLESSERPDLEMMTGLRNGNRTVLCNDQGRILEIFNGFINGIAGKKHILSWSGQDATLLGLNGNPEISKIDVYAAYKVWMTQNNIMRKNNVKLSNAVLDLFGPLIAYEPHRAYEDAIATAAIFHVITD